MAIEMSDTHFYFKITFTYISYLSKYNRNNNILIHTKYRDFIHKKLKH